MPDTTFHEETIRVIRHLQRRLITIIDSAHSPEMLKSAIVDYLESLIRAGPHYVDVEENRRPAKRRDPPPRLPDIMYPLTGPGSRNASQKIIHNSGLHRFSSPADRETVFHGIRIPPGCDVVELPSVRPHVRDFFFVEGNVRHFVSIDDRPTSRNSPSDRVIFHSTCPQQDKNRQTSTVLKGYRVHKPYIAVCPVDDRDYDVDDNLSENYFPPADNVKSSTPPCCRAVSNERKLKKIVNIPEIGSCDQGTDVRLSSNDNSYDMFDKCRQRAFCNLGRQTDFQQYCEKKPQSNCGHAQSSKPSCGHWSCNLRNAIDSHAQVENVEPVRKVKMEPSPNDSTDSFPGREHSAGCPVSKLDKDIQIKVEESIANYEKTLREKYDPNMADNSETKVFSDHRYNAGQHHTDVAEFEKQLNEKYCTKHTCGKQDSIIDDSGGLRNCDQTTQIKREVSTTDSIDELEERIRGITEGVRKNLNQIEEDTTSENMGDETFMERMLRVDPPRSCQEPMRRITESPKN